MRENLIRPNQQSTAANPVVLLWKSIQALFWVIGITILIFLMYQPAVGITLFWNILIPVAPALLVVGASLWRNVCPLATTAMLPDRFRFSMRIPLTSFQRNLFNLIAVLALFAIIPIRHVIFDRDGQATAILIMLVTLVAVISGFFFERKSGWCSGLCPIHPVEKLYGSSVAFSVPNLHCSTCDKCSDPCPDSISNFLPKVFRNSTLSIVNEYLIVGAFPGYVWGWFQLPDFRGSSGWEHLLPVYGFPVLGATITLSAYALLKHILSKRQEETLVSFFAATAVSCYYWYRLPQLIGYSALDINGVLIDLTSVLPTWTPFLLNTISTAFFFWWLVIRAKPLRSWSKRPEYTSVRIESPSAHHSSKKINRFPKVEEDSLVK